jgi:hypothetical protein
MFWHAKIVVRVLGFERTCWQICMQKNAIYFVKKYLLNGLRPNREIDLADR